MEPPPPLLLVTAILLTLIVCNADSKKEGSRRNPKIFDVTEHGAIGDGKPHIDNSDDEPTCINAMAFIQTWQAACHYPGVEPAKVLIPKMKFVTGPVVFMGPCTNRDVIVEIQGTVSVNHDHELYANPEWFSISKVNGLKITGPGCVDADVKPEHNTPLDCKEDMECEADASGTFLIENSSNVAVENLTLLNSRFYHIYIVSSHNVNIRGVTLIGPENRPNTDGVRITMSDSITVANSIFSTGDDCVSIDEGCSNININNVLCGPGNGISLEPLGKEEDKKDVRGVTVRNCTFKETNTGVAIRTVPGKTSIQATQILFQDLIMDKVKHPIVIDQQFSNKKPKPVGSSHVKISGVQFKNIKGTTTSKPPQLSFICSETNPCEDIIVNNVHLSTAETGEKMEATCLNAKVIFSGQNNGLACHCPAAVRSATSF